MYVRIYEDGTMKYPYSLLDLKKDFPNSIIGKNEETLNSFNVFSVVDEFPEITNTQTVEYSSVPILKNGKYTIEYFIFDTPIEELMKAKQEHAERVIQAHINSFVISKGYDNENSIAKYLVADNPFYAECSALSLWIGAVWVKAHEVMAQVLGGTLAEPTDEELIALMPIFGE